MLDDLLFGSIDFHLRVTCADPKSDLDYVIPIEGVIVADIEQDDDTAEDVEVGRIKALLVQTTQVANDRVSLYEVCDAHSAELESVCAALFNVKTDEPREELGIEAFSEGLLYLDEIAVNPKYRDSGIVVRTIEAMIRTFCPGGLVATHYEAMDLTGEEWRRLGFVKVAESPVAFIDKASRNPYERMRASEEE